MGSACWASDFLSVIPAFAARTVAVFRCLPEDVHMRKRVCSTKTSSVAMLRELPPNPKYLHCFRNLPAITKNMFSEVKMHWIHPDILVFPIIVVLHRRCLHPGYLRQQFDPGGHRIKVIRMDKQHPSMTSLQMSKKMYELPALYSFTNVKRLPNTGD